MVRCTPGAEAQTCAPIQTNAAPLNIDFSVGSGFGLAHSLLARTDGAAVLDAEGRMLGIEVQLAVSDNSRNIIPPAPGTRRTSARRYSCDFPEAIVFAVSADGPVLVFSDGLEVAKLSSIDPEAFASFITSSAHTRKRAYVGQSESVCARCGKTSIIINTEVHGMRECARRAIVNAQIGAT
jgi:DisA bacterial checkpoint controller nucleotide-binding